MKKRIFYFCMFCFISSISYAQVGINTETPKATLDIVASLSNNTVPPGMIAPRISRAQLTSISSEYTQDQLGSIIYITDLSGETNDDTRNISSLGYHYYDGSNWLSISNADTKSPWYKIGTNISSTLNSDNSYLKAKVVIGGDSIEGVNGGTANAQLTVTGGDASINGITIGRGAGNIQNNTVVGASSLNANTTGSNNTVLGANAGIKITTGSNNLVIGANTDVISETNNNQMNIANTLYGITGNSPTNTGRVSIGKTIPDNGVTLDVNGTTQIVGEKAFRYIDGNQKANSILVSDSLGNATWETVNALNSPMYPTASSGNGYTGDLVSGINSGISITLPPYSVWVVELGQIVRFSRYLKVYTNSSGNIEIESVWIRLIWSDTPTGSVSADVLSGKLISGACYAGGEFHLIAGTSVIQNDSDQEKTYYLTTDNANLYSIDPSSPITVEGLFRNWGENSLVVIPANNQSLDPEN